MEAMKSLAGKLQDNGVWAIQSLYRSKFDTLVQSERLPFGWLNKDQVEWIAEFFRFVKSCPFHEGTFHTGKGRKLRLSRMVMDFNLQFSPIFDRTGRHDELLEFVQLRHWDESLLMTKEEVVSLMYLEFMECLGIVKFPEFRELLKVK